MMLNKGEEKATRSESNKMSLGLIPDNPSSQDYFPLMWVTNSSKSKHRSSNASSPTSSTQNDQLHHKISHHDNGTTDHRSEQESFLLIESTEVNGTGREVESNVGRATPEFLSRNSVVYQVAVADSKDDNQSLMEIIPVFTHSTSRGDDNQGISAMLENVVEFENLSCPVQTECEMKSVRNHGFSDGGAAESSMKEKPDIPLFPLNAGTVDSMSHPRNDSKTLTTNNYNFDLQWNLNVSAKPFECQKCGKGFKYAGTYSRHLECHLGERTHICDKCGKGFVRSDHLTVHERSHSGEKTHKCIICDKKFCSTSARNKHLRIHSANRPFKCSICGKGFKQSETLAEHEKSHTGAKPHKCEHCGVGFTKLSSVKRHERIHTGERPYICKTCGNAFTDASTLRQHVMTHSMIKPFNCRVCQKSFAKASMLNLHLWRHTGEKPFLCNFCGTLFNSVSSLKRHLTNHSKENGSSDNV